MSLYEANHNQWDTVGRSQAYPFGQWQQLKCVQRKRKKEEKKKGGGGEVQCVCTEMLNSD